MNELIPIKENNGKQAVSARDLHTFLESKKDFSNWIKHRIEKYGFIENVDFIKLTQMGEPGNQRIEYVLTIDAAKELSMVEGNAKGKQARQYFIEREKLSYQVQKPLSTLEFMELSVKQMREHENRLDYLETKINSILEVQTANEAELKAIPVSTEVVPEITLRDKVRLMVNRYAIATGTFQKTVWDNIYQTLYYTYHVSIKSYKRSKDQSLLDVAEQHEHLDKIFLIVSKMIREKGLAE